MRSETVDDIRGVAPGTGSSQSGWKPTNETIVWMDAKLPLLKTMPERGGGRFPPKHAAVVYRSRVALSVTRRDGGLTRAFAAVR